MLTKSSMNLHNHELGLSKTLPNSCRMNSKLKRNFKDRVKRLSLPLGGLVEFQAQHASLVHTAALQLATCPTSHTPRPEEHPISKVLPYLFLGNERDSMSAEKLRQHCITSVINVTQATPMPPAEAEVRALRLPAADNGTQNLRQYFDEAFAFIESVRAEGGILLVHCYAGISRSATVTIAYLMKFHNMSLTDAYNFVKKCRPVISPNLNFMGQLLQLEEELAAERGVAPSAPGLTSINCGTVPPPPTPNTPTFHNSDLATGRLLSKATCKLPAIRDDELCGATAEALDISDEPKRDKILHPTGGGDLLESSEYSSTPPL